MIDVAVDKLFVELKEVVVEVLERDQVAVMIVEVVAVVSVLVTVVTEVLDVSLTVSVTVKVGVMVTVSVIMVAVDTVENVNDPVKLRDVTVPLLVSVNVVREVLEASLAVSVPEVVNVIVAVYVDVNVKLDV